MLSLLLSPSKCQRTNDLPRTASLRLKLIDRYSVIFLAQYIVGFLIFCCLGLSLGVPFLRVFYSYFFNLTLIHRYHLRFFTSIYVIIFILIISNILSPYTLDYIYVLKITCSFCINNKIQ